MGSSTFIGRRGVAEGKLYPEYSLVLSPLGFVYNSHFAIGLEIKSGSYQGLVRRLCARFLAPSDRYHHHLDSPTALSSTLNHPRLLTGLSRRVGDYP